MRAPLPFTGIALAALLAGACATTSTTPTAPPPTTADGDVDKTPRVTGKEVFESEDWIVAIARPGDTSERLAKRFLGDSALAWRIEDYNDRATFTAGEAVVIPKRSWNTSGVEPSGYQLVPVLVYHDIAPQAKGRMVIAAKTFEEQMQYLKAQGYRVVSMRDFYDFISLNRQLPRKAVLLTFDDGYKSFMTYAYPVLKQLGFTATLFVYTDYVGAGRNALTWDDLNRLAREGFDVEGHSKTHSDLRRRQGESEAEQVRRLRSEMDVPQKLFQQRFGQPARFLAYPYGAQDDTVLQNVREFGYVAGFTVFREGNSAFVHPFRVRRSQIYSEMSLEDFAKNLNTFSHETLK
ncbi:MAG TPA: polysaccharide deacetylase family protein [Methylomirabilota bacterium]